MMNQQELGGGATDIRLVSGEWNDFESLKSRIMVAGGGRRSILWDCRRSRRRLKRINK
ncbi:MAG: glycine rich domain-containing protein [Clostridia bacterium]|uniref:glycine rich domain-containing protein n=1 Tax=Methanobrevibacter smithii TaxID=2173 RepID=UPI00384F2B40